MKRVRYNKQKTSSLNLTNSTTGGLLFIPHRNTEIHKRKYHEYILYIILLVLLFLLFLIVVYFSYHFLIVREVWDPVSHFTIRIQRNGGEEKTYDFAGDAADNV